MCNHPYPRLSLLTEAHAQQQFMALLRANGFFPTHHYTRRPGRFALAFHVQIDSLRVPALLCMRQPGER